MPFEFKRGIRAPEVTTQSATPAAGDRFLYPKADGWYEKTSAGVETKIGPSAGGGGGTSGAQFDLTTDYSTTKPAAPATGVNIFARHKARRLLAMQGPNGLDTPVQPGIFNNRISLWSAVNNVAAPSVWGGAALTVTGTNALVPVTATNFYAAQVRSRYSTTATAGVAAGARTPTAQWHLSSTANKGGFFFVCRFGLNAATATNRIFIGLSTTTAALSATVDPTTLFNLVGFGCNSAHSTFRFISNAASGTANAVDMGANFPCQATAAGVNFYEARLFAPAGGGANVYYSIERLNDGVVAQGQVTTQLPALDTLMSAHIHHSNGTTAAIASTDLQTLYIENDN